MQLHIRIEASMRFPGAQAPSKQYTSFSYFLREDQSPAPTSPWFSLLEYVGAKIERQTLLFQQL